MAGRMALFIEDQFSESENQKTLPTKICCHSA
jgi:hypothetical protein